MCRSDWEHHPDPSPKAEGRPLGYRRWADLVDDDHTRLMPIITPAMRYRGGDLQWDPRRR